MLDADVCWFGLVQLFVAVLIQYPALFKKSGTLQKHARQSTCRGEPADHTAQDVFVASCQPEQDAADKSSAVPLLVICLCFSGRGQRG
jgi:hypothetical protein